MTEEQARKDLIASIMKRGFSETSANTIIGGASVVASDVMFAMSASLVKNYPEPLHFEISYGAAMLLHKTMAELISIIDKMGALDRPAK